MHKQNKGKSELWILTSLAESIVLNYKISLELSNLVESTSMRLVQWNVPLVLIEYYLHNKAFPYSLLIRNLQQTRSRRERLPQLNNIKLECNYYSPEIPVSYTHLDVYKRQVSKPM